MMKVNLRRGRLEVIPVYSTTFAHPGPSVFRISPFSTRLVLIAKMQMVKVNLRRERLEVNPVYSTAFAHPGPSGRPTTTGYIRLVNFNMHAAEDVQKAIRNLKVVGGPARLNSALHF